LWVFGWEAKRCGINHRVWTQDCQRFPGLTRGLIADNFQAAGWGLDGLLFCSLLLIVIFMALQLRKKTPTDQKPKIKCLLPDFMIII